MCTNALWDEALYELVDTHAHLMIVENLNQALKRAERVGVTAIITMGSDHKSNEWALETSEKKTPGKIKIYAA